MRILLYEGFKEARLKWINQGNLPQTVDEAIKIFKELRSKKWLKTEINDIDKWAANRTFEEFRSTVMSIYGEKKEKEDEELGVVEILNKRKYALYRAVNFEGMSELAEDSTDWCVARSDGYFDDYTKNGKMFFVLEVHKAADFGELPDMDSREEDVGIVYENKFTYNTDKIEDIQEGRLDVEDLDEEDLWERGEEEIYPCDDCWYKKEMIIRYVRDYHGGIGHFKTLEGEEMSVDDISKELVDEIMKNCCCVERLPISSYTYTGLPKYAILVTEDAEVRGVWNETDTLLDEDQEENLFNWAEGALDAINDYINERKKRKYKYE